MSVRSCACWQQRSSLSLILEKSLYIYVQFPYSFICFGLIIVIEITSLYNLHEIWYSRISGISFSSMCSDSKIFSIDLSEYFGFDFLRKQIFFEKSSCNLVYCECFLCFPWIYYFCCSAIIRGFKSISYKFHLNHIWDLNLVHIEL